jgi:hypothetical protein
VLRLKYLGEVPTVSSLNRINGVREQDVEPLNLRLCRDQSLLVRDGTISTPLSNDLVDRPGDSADTSGTPIPARSARPPPRDLDVCCLASTFLAVEELPLQRFAT